MKGHRISFGPFAFDPATLTLWRDGALVPLGRRGAAILLTLLESGGGVVGKEVLMERGWPGAIVEESNLVVQVATLRKVLGERPDGDEWIATVPRVGYRLPREEAPATQSRPALAVLPFVNMSDDPAQQHFADGLVEDLITALSRFTSFAVVARQSSFAFRDRALDIRQIAAALDVRYLLEGSIRRIGRDVRINAQLIDGTTGAHIWGEKLDGTVDDIFAFHDRVTASVAGLVEPLIGRAELERARRKPPENLDAYDLYLQALPWMRGPRNEKLDAYGIAIELLDRAIALDPGFTPALAYAAWAHEKRLTRAGVPPPGVDDAERAIALSERALLTDENDPLAILVAGVVLVTVKHEDRGHALVKRAAALNPNSVIITTTAAYMCMLRGSCEEAVTAYERSLALAPGSPDTVYTLSGLARSRLAVGRVEESLATALRALEFEHPMIFPFCTAAACYAHLGKLDDARTILARVLDAHPSLTLGNLFGRVGRLPGDGPLVEGLIRAGLPAG